MKRLVVTIVLLPMVIMFAPLIVQATSIVNITTVFQGNFCAECNRISQFNKSMVRQTISFKPVWFKPEYNSLLVNTLSSLATVNQSNVCHQCNRVLQNNSTVVLQSISTHKYTSALPKTPTTGSSPNLIANMTGVAQGNLCVGCSKSKQKSTSVIKQNIRLLDPVALGSTDSSSGSEYSLFSNFTRIEQENFCVFCEGSLQTNLALVVQNIRVAPEPGTLILLGSGLAGLYGLARKKFV